MSLLEFSNLSFGYTDEYIIRDASGQLQPGNVIGLVGQNGGGKTTLLKLIEGRLTPEAGNIQVSRGTQITIVTQSSGGTDTDTLREFVRGGRADLVELQERMGKLVRELEHRPEDEALQAELGSVQERFAVLDGHRWETDIDRIISGLSFTDEQHNQTLGSMSGGQRQKACLARALISDANCLIFDEPTNHLDIEAQEFFADYLKSLRGRAGVILVSHDRWLLDSVCTHIWEVDNQGLFRYPGNYTKYRPQRDLRRRAELDQFQKQQEHIAKTEEYIRRNIAGQNTKQAQGRRKLLGRMERVDRPADDPQMSFVLKPALLSGEQLLIVEQLCFSYSGLERSEEKVYEKVGHSGLALNPPMEMARGPVGDGLLLDDVDFQLYRGERMGIVGSNGCGKSTLLKLLARRLAPLRGMVAWGSNADVGVFSQDSADLQDGRDLMAELRSVDGNLTDGEVRSYLAVFGFSGDEVFKDVKQLSGGERSRLTLAKIFRRRPNVLLLDEPTNHLDIWAREALEQFLLAYEGSLIMVTHDRALLERICNRLVVFEREGEADNFSSSFFRGHYSEYRRFREAMLAEQNAQAARDSGNGNAEDDEWTMLEQAAKEARTNVEGYCRRQQEKVEQRIAQVELTIEELERRIRQLADEQHSVDAASDYERIATLQLQIDELGNERDEVFGSLEPLIEEADLWQGRITQLKERQQV
ncbi:MAG: ATP-binding cassette domain-containing protein [Planctomycetales bacterium]|nr:ATP-binding cassette domain-containing protein [bacterium]UNM08674.1 MAG: ATP-binding cassette domain-containing protein [Planctomycetales bacterium]